MDNDGKTKNKPSKGGLFDDATDMELEAFHSFLGAAVENMHEAEQLLAKNRTYLAMYFEDILTDIELAEEMRGMIKAMETKISVVGASYDELRGKAVSIRGLVEVALTNLRQKKSKWRLKDEDEHE